MPIEGFKDSMARLVILNLMQSQMKKKVEHVMETGLTEGLIQQ